MSQKVLITGGTGLIGKRLTEMLLQKGYEVAYLSRKKTDIPSVKVYEWNIEKGYIEEGALDNLDYLIHLAGEGVAEGRWTEDRKKAIISSRIETIKLIAKKLKENNILPKALISASGSSYYPEGDQHNTEESPAGISFLAQVTIQWEKAADAVKNLAFSIKELVDNLFLVFTTLIDDKPGITVMLSENLVAERGLNASNIVRELAKDIQGGGGGQPFYATAGGKNKEGLSKVLEKVTGLVPQA